MKTKKSNKKGARVTYSAAERRAYWIGYGRRLEQLDIARNHFQGLTNVERISMNEGSRSVDKKYK